jgi:hypothetical protein
MKYMYGYSNLPDGAPMACVYEGRWVELVEVPAGLSLDLSSKVMKAIKQL